MHYVVHSVILLKKFSKGDAKHDCKKVEHEKYCIEHSSGLKNKEMNYIMQKI